ncbi:MAG: tRNA (adenosine(37)-N6)-dimethylallyltransferase MiaA, partial [Candidatus Liptonbacteria bacterium]|nr:tRNA (adenosine(37)-N6)-dimethylallyltransferase MiaA [Candidatus Liptonbacteria bacterium]
NIKNPDENYTVAEYKKNAIAATNKIIKKGKIPLLVGGTGLYVKAVTENLEIPEVKPDHKLRSRLERKIEKEGLEKVFEELLEIDPEAAYIVDGKNPRRVVRALEVTILTNKPFSAQRKKGKNLFETFKIGIELSPATLKKRIYKRADKMVKKGLVGEVKKLVKKYGERQIAFDAIGYKEIINYLNGKISLKEARELMNKNTLNFAKRQMTWFKKDKEIKWVEKESETFPLVKNFLLADKKQ